MDIKPTLIKLLNKILIPSLAGVTVFFIACIVAVVFFTEEKSWFEKSWELVTGGSVGALAGLLFYLIIGGIGFVAGPLIYGSLGLLSLIIGGVLSGLGFGAIANVIRNPDDYNFIEPGFSLMIILGIVIGVVLFIFLYKRASRSLPAQTPK